MFDKLEYSYRKKTISDGLLNDEQNVNKDDPCSFIQHTKLYCGNLIFTSLNFSNGHKLSYLVVVIYLILFEVNYSRQLQ